MTSPEVEDTTLHFPRILCLHGGGTNARIFRLQCRVLSKHLSPYFRLVYPEAPFLSQAGPDVVSVYRNFGPFKRWLRWLAEHPNIEARIAVEAIEGALEAAMREDDSKGATGEWVAILGFSQGAKMAASLLLRQQARKDKLGRNLAGSNFKFGVLLAGRGPLVSLDPELTLAASLVDASQIGSENLPNQNLLRTKEHILRLPTIHVHGIQDQGLELHRRLLEDSCEKESTKVVEWNGDHRVPIKEKDVSAVVRGILALAKETGVLTN